MDVFLLTLFLLTLYLLPLIVAMAREHHNQLAIGMTNILLGWTFLGWVIALIWACTVVRSTAPPSPANDYQPSI